VAAGRELRNRVSRGSHADWQPSAARLDPVAILEASNVGRLPELIPLRYGRMLVSPFTFLRGSAAVMASDLAQTPTTGLSVQACGDCHLMNFGIFATPERNVVFGLNDFDETLRGPWEWDVKRLAASFVVAARDMSVGDRDARAVAVAAVAAYRQHLWRHTGQSPLEVWYDRIDAQQAIEEAPDKAARQRRERLLAQAQRRVAENLFPKLVQTGDERMTIVDQPPLIYHPADANVAEVAADFLGAYRESLPEDRRVLLDRYRLQDAAVKVVGVGSVGTRCFVALLTSAGGHPLILQVKEANPSVLQPFTGGDAPEHNGERVVVGQRLLQPASDIFLGWATGAGGRQFYVRQLRDMKLSVTLNRDPVQLSRYAEYCGRGLARAHANTGDVAAIAGYLGKSTQFDNAIATFSMAYADQTAGDHRVLVDAARDGRIEVLDEFA
jgi:uncharacterized protein (DUF2252 family)